MEPKNIIRRSTRVPLNINVIVNYSNKEIKAVTHDISIDGMFIKSNEKLDKNSLVHCYLFIPDREEPISTLAKILYDGFFTYTGKESFYGVGLHFIEMTEEGRDYLRKYLEKEFYHCKKYRVPRKISSDNI